MRPHVPEIVRGLSAGLAADVLPEVASPWGQAQMRYAFTLLETVRTEWDAAADNLFVENAALQVFCRSAAERAAVESAPSELAALGGSLADAAALAPTADIRISTLDARNQQLWRAVEPLIAIVVASEEAPWAAALKAELAPLLRAYVTRRGYRPSG